MSLTDELHRLGELHERRVLTDAEFAQAKARLLQAQEVADVGSFLSAINALRRSSTDRWIAGVCGGIAKTTGLASWAWRLLLTGLFFCFGVGLLLYILLWIFVPRE